MLHNKEGFSEMIVAHAPNCMIAINEAGIIHTYNRAAEVLLGYSSEEMVGKHISTLFTEWTKDVMHAANTKSFFLVHARRKDGKQILLEGRRQEGHVNSERFQLFFLQRSPKDRRKKRMTFRYKKLAPMMVTEAAAAYYSAQEEVMAQLLAEKNRLEIIIDTIADAIMVINSDGVILQANKVAEKIFGWSKEELIGKRAPIVPVHLWQETVEIIHQVWTGQPIVGYETVRQRKDGSLIDMSITYSPIYNSRGQVMAIVSIFRDITERKRTDEFLRNSYKLSVVGEMAAGIAHEIRNPLTALRGFVQLMKADQEKKEIYLDIMLSELDRINDIVSELLLLSKPSEITFQRQCAKTLLNDVVTLLETQAIINNVQIEKQLADDCFIICEQNQLKQVLINLIKNAIEAMPQGGMMTIKLTKEAGKIIISIQDEGCGIDKERLPRLGEPFYTTKKTGTGLGLMVSFKIIREHGGDIKIESELNKGTTVTIILPRADTD